MDEGDYHSREKSGGFDGDRGLEMVEGSQGPNGVNPAAISAEPSGFGLEDDGAETASRYPDGNSSSFGAVSNFLNTIVGAGIIGLPYALSQVTRMLSFCARPSS